MSSSLCISLPLSLSFLDGADIVFPRPSETDLDSRLRVINRRFTYTAFESWTTLDSCRKGRGRIRGVNCKGTGGKGLRASARAQEGPEKKSQHTVLTPGILVSQAPHIIALWLFKFFYIEE